MTRSILYCAILCTAAWAQQPAAESRAETKAETRPATRPAEARQSHPRLGFKCEAVALEQSGIARVESVSPGSAAEKAGLKVGDIVLSVAGTTIKDDKSYRDAMANRKVGDSIPIHIRRGADDMDLEAMLTEVRRAEPESVTVQHCLIAFKGASMSQATRTQEEAKKLAEDILKKVKSGEDFSDIITKYTDDAHSKASIPPGSYTIANDGKNVPGASARSGPNGMVPLWGSIAFSLEVGDAALASYDKDLAPHGYYVIKRLR